MVRREVAGLGEVRTRGGGVVRAPIAALLLGCLMSLALSGYNVGKSNHTVYLLDAYRQLDGSLLANDWFTNHTLQYHGVFSLLTRWSIQLGVFEGVFLAGFLLTVAAFHYYIWRIVMLLRGWRGDGRDDTDLAGGGTYLLTVLLFHLFAGGTGLGGFQFLQDGAFLPSNVANVAMLAGIAYLMELRVWAAAVALGIAGLFHINHAVFAPFVLVAGLLAQPNRVGLAGGGGERGVGGAWRGIVMPVLLMTVLVGANLLPALVHLRSEQAGAVASKMPLDEFVAIYAKLRHPHHYYPPGWHAAVYIASLWSLVPAALVLLLRRYELPVVARRVMYSVMGMLAGAMLFAFLFAGVMFVSERLIQIAIFRFSIYLMLLTCAITAWGLMDSGLVSRRVRGAVFVGIAVVVAAALVLGSAGTFGQAASWLVSRRPGPLWVSWGLGVLAMLYAWLGARGGTKALRNWVLAGVGALPLVWWSYCFGLDFIPEDPPEYVEMAHWAREHTPKDAIFLVPPNEQSWRLDALRAVVVNFKAIPQTAAEMPGWKQRMVDVTGVADLPSLAGTFSSTLSKLGEIYESRPEAELVAVAKKYGCRYIVTTRKLNAMTQVYPPLQEAQTDASVRYRLYDLGS